MTSYIRRNAPCPCGSGKRYKHCCSGAESSIQVTKGQARATDAEGLLDEGNALFCQAIELQYQNPVQALKTFEQALGRYEEVLREGYKEALNNSGAVYCKFAEIYHTQGQLQEALDALEQAHERYKEAIQEGYKEALNNSGNAYSESASIYHPQGQLQKALDALEQAHERYAEAIQKGDKNALNNSGFAYLESARIYHTQGQLQKALDALEQAHERYAEALQAGYKEALNNSGNAYLESARIYHTQGQLQKALNALGLAQGRYEEALQKGYKEALFNSGSAYLESARIYRTQGQLQKALDALAQAQDRYEEAIQKRDKKALNNSGVAYLESAGILHPDPSWIFPYSGAAQRFRQAIPYLCEDIQSFRQQLVGAKDFARQIIYRKQELQGYSDQYPELIKNALEILKFTARFSPERNPDWQYELAQYFLEEKDFVRASRWAMAFWEEVGQGQDLVRAARAVGIVTMVLRQANREKAVAFFLEHAKAWCERLKGEDTDHKTAEAVIRLLPLGRALLKKEDEKKQYLSLAMMALNAITPTEDNTQTFEELVKLILVTASDINGSDRITFMQDSRDKCSSIFIDKRWQPCYPAERPNPLKDLFEVPDQQLHADMEQLVKKAQKADLYDAAIDLVQENWQKNRLSAQNLQTIWERFKSYCKEKNIDSNDRRVFADIYDLLDTVIAHQDIDLTEFKEKLPPCHERNKPLLASALYFMKVYAENKYQDYSPIIMMLIRSLEREVNKALIDPMREAARKLPAERRPWQDNKEAYGKNDIARRYYDFLFENKPEKFLTSDFLAPLSVLSGARQKPSNAKVVDWIVEWIEANKSYSPLKQREVSDAFFSVKEIRTPAAHFKPEKIPGQKEAQQVSELCLENIGENLRALIPLFNQMAPPTSTENSDFTSPIMMNNTTHSIQ
ncbi:MAG TPA: tetratricopeptide repeat protein [Desulfobulbaceae bacterium]|nr:tetratricopeptide repeat protein [Desulfobulbaceae bacterium]